MLPGSSPPAGRKSGVGLNLLIAAGATMVFLAAGEAGLRALGLPRDGLGSGAMGGRYVAEHLGGSLRPWQEEDADLLWRLRPGQVAVEEANRGSWIVHTNSEGMRSPELRARPGRPRVLCLGDSVTMGYGVDDAATYPSALQELLRGTDGLEDAEVINAGVLGYTSEQGRVLAARLVPRLRPDVVVVDYGINDNWPTVYPDPSLIDQTGIVRRLQRLLGRSRIYATLRKQIVHTKLKRAAAARRTGARVTPERYRENLEAIVAAVRAGGSHPILVAPTSKVADHYQSKTLELHTCVQVYRNVMALVAAEHSVPFVDNPVLSGRERESRWRFMDFCHPDAEGMCILAGEVAPIVRTELAPK